MIFHVDSNSLHFTTHSLFHANPHILTDAISNYAQQNLELLRDSGLHRKALEVAMGLNRPLDGVKSAIGQAYNSIKPFVANRFSEKVQQVAQWADLYAQVEGCDIPSLASKVITSPVKNTIKSIVVA